VPESLSLPGRIATIPEFHDCQRFIGPGEQYGSLYAIWVREGLDNTVFPSRGGGGIPGRADSVGEVRGRIHYGVGDSIVMVTGVRTDSVGVAVALVWSDSLPYQPLGIQRGFNCLYLYDPPAWKATMVPVGEQQNCNRVRNVDPRGVGTPLNVRPVRARPFLNADYPPVARWDADQRGRYFIGIKCAAAWCEIGNNIGTSPSYPGHRTRRVRGWYDEQYLAVSSQSGPGRPTRILGTIIPDSLLDRYIGAGFPADTFVTVAWTALTTGPGKPDPDPADLQAYKTKFNFDAASVGDSMNQIQFCRGSKAACIPADEPKPPPCPPADTLWARIISGKTKATEYHCVTHTKHPGVQIPGVVRWRWLANDEQGWVSCPNGCCKVN
jgi:hypothetical protein